MEKRHHYEINIKWTGNTGSGTETYLGYQRSHEISVPGKPVIFCSSDPAFRGDKAKYNPEELLVSALSSCHMLWFLHLCADAGIVVTDYSDAASGTMAETLSGGGRFIEVTLNPVVTLTDRSLAEKTVELHRRAHELCFIANSVNFPVRHNPSVR